MKKTSRLGRISSTIIIGGLAMILNSGCETTGVNGFAAAVYNANARSEARKGNYGAANGWQMLGDAAYAGHQRELAEASAPRVNVTVNNSRGNNERGVYTVQKGDTLGTIARKYNVPLAEILEVNAIDPHRTRVGQRINIPKPKKLESSGKSLKFRKDKAPVFKDMLSIDDEILYHLPTETLLRNKGAGLYTLTKKFLLPGKINDADEMVKEIDTLYIYKNESYGYYIVRKKQD